MGIACARAVLALNALWAGTGKPGELLDIDLERFKDSVSKMKDLSAAVRDYVQQNAQRAFDGLDAEEAKRQ